MIAIVSPNKVVPVEESSPPTIAPTWLALSILFLSIPKSAIKIEIKASIPESSTLSVGFFNPFFSLYFSKIESTEPKPISI